MKGIAIQDANILIDLLKTGMLDHCLALQYQFMTTDIILFELYDAQVDLIQPHISSGKFAVITISATELIEIRNLSLNDRNLSEQDWSALYYALKKNALLLTGDKRMRAVAEKKSVPYRGILWLMDELVSNKIISVQEACLFLKKLMRANKRLPLSECEVREKQWCQFHQ